MRSSSARIRGDLPARAPPLTAGLRRAAVHSVGPSAYSPRLRAFLTSRGDDRRAMNASLVTEELGAIVRQRGARRGDVAKIWELAACDNDWTYIFDGDTLLPLGRQATLDSAGYVPPSFPVLEGDFGPKYWSQAVAHNRIVWFDARPFLPEIRHSLDPHVYARYVGPETYRRYPGFSPQFLADLQPFARFSHQGSVYLLALDFYTIGSAGDAPLLVEQAVDLAAQGLQPWNWYPSIEPAAERVLLASTEMLGWA